MSNLRPVPDPTSFAPRYREAYAQFDIGRASAAFKRGEIICEFSDQFDEHLGIARFDLRGDRCQLEYNIRTPVSEHVHKCREFDLTPIANGIAKGRVTVKCPGCKTRKKILFFKDKWRCATCHDLSFRSQLIHPLAKEWEKFDALTTHLKSGKPHGIHNDTYIGLLNKLEAIQHNLRNESRRYASRNFSNSVKAVWREHQSMDDFFLFSMNAEEKLNKKETECEPTLPPLLGPCFSEPHSSQVFGGDYETDDPDRM